MGQACTVCTHPKREELDAAIVSGQPNRRVAPQYGVDEKAIRRHKAHITAALVDARERRAERAIVLSVEVEEVYRALRRVAACAEMDGRWGEASQALGRSLDALSVLGDPADRTTPKLDRPVAELVSEAKRLTGEIVLMSSERLQ